MTDDREHRLPYRMINDIANYRCYQYNDYDDRLCCIMICIMMAMLQICEQIRLLIAVIVLSYC